MSNTSKVVGAVIGVLLIGGIWWYASNSNAPKAAAVLAPTQTDTAVQTTSSGVSASANAAASDSSDTSMQRDTSSIDAQMSGLNSDNASTDSGLSNQ